MRSVAAWLLGVVLAAGCAPDYAGTSFLCDGQHGCPSGQSCVGGRCSVVASTADGVVCGATTCGITQACCAFPSAPYCADTGGVDGCQTLSARCDGVEDCVQGATKQFCCQAEDTDTPGHCAASCDIYVCRAADDCPGSLPLCCAIPGGQIPWKACYPPGSCPTTAVGG